MSGYIQRLFDRAAVTAPSSGGYSSSQSLSSQQRLQSAVRSGSPLADHDQRLLNPHYQSGLASPLGTEGVFGEDMATRFEHLKTDTNMITPPMTNQAFDTIDARPLPSAIENPAKVTSKQPRRNTPDHKPAEHFSRSQPITETDKHGTPIIHETTESVTKIIQHDRKPESLPTESNASFKLPNTLPDPAPELSTRIIKTVTHPDWQPPPEDKHPEAKPALSTKPEPETQPELQIQPRPENRNGRIEEYPVSRSDTRETNPVMAQVPQLPQPEPVPDPSLPPPQAPVKIIEKIVETNKNPQPPRNRHSGPLTAHSVSKIGHLPQRQRSFSLFGMRRR